MPSPRPKKATREKQLAAIRAGRDPRHSANIEADDVVVHPRDTLDRVDPKPALRVKS